MLRILKPIKKTLKWCHIWPFYEKYRELKLIGNIHKNYLDVIKKIRNKVQNKEKINVLFFISQCQLWCVDSLYKELLKGSIFNPVAIVFPNGENRVKSAETTCKENYEFFKKNNINVQYGYDIKTSRFYDLKELDADIIFYDQPFPFLPEKLLFDEASKNALICYVPYGYKIANFYHEHYNLELHNKAWRVFAESNWHKEQFTKFGKGKGKNVEVSGYPKLDVYNDKTLPVFEWKLKEKAAARIIWAPHWSFSDSELSYSTFDKYFNEFIRYAREHIEVDWVFKPHQRLKYECITKGLMTEKEADDYYYSWDDLPNGKVYLGGNYFELFKTSDALITDCGSFLAEYMPTKQPILQLININSIGYNPVGQKITENYYKAYCFSEIRNFIENIVIKKDDHLRGKRLEALQYVIINRDGAGKFIKNYLESTVDFKC